MTRSRFEGEFELALEQREYQQARIRWDIASRAGRLAELGWGSLEDAILRQR